MKKREMSEKFERGLETRRAVLGDRYVEKALDGATDYNWPMQVFVTEYCWDEIWNRPGLSRKERSLLNLGMVASQGRPNEMKAHVRGAINNGWTREELREAFLQIAAYCGVPTAIDSFKIAQEVFTELDGEGGV
ncbi:carboxymuconolactone decarboxylase family protein [Achromobacter spanius]|uniref:carboxymuconolactone decarboxylase family protein n=1 Tax=Achromobacter spanius TaxID=217203 RepID=UPI00320B81DE